MDHVRIDVPDLKGAAVEFVRDHRPTVAMIGSIATGVAAFVSTPNWVLAGIITMLAVSFGVAVIMVLKRFETQDHAIDDCKREKLHKTTEHDNCMRKLHRRDTLLAVLLAHSRRKGDKQLLDTILGEEDAGRARTEAKVLVRELKRT